ncbi:hypothetical protein MBESOW_P3418 [Sphingobium xenophagum]|uniref:Beta-barrel porin 2 n=2 Tax=Sphingobium xenophagum TaxID=121428 RepID=A0A401J6A3_SPHXE|nr:hypothetical protein MBESOW_P3418 [Sphingobium xenophagum]
MWGPANRIRRVPLFVFACMPVLGMAIGAARAQSGEGAPPLLVSEDDRLPNDDGVYVGVQAASAYFDNFLQISDGATPPAGVSKSDVVTSTGGYIAARETISLQQVYASGFINKRLHARNTQYNNVAAAAQAGWAWRLGTACDGQVEGRYNRSQGDFADEGSFVENIRTSRSLIASGQCPLADILTPRLNYATSSTENSALGREDLNYDSESLGIDLSLSRTSRLVIAATGDRALWIYPSRPGPSGVGVESVERVSLGGRISYNPTGKLGLSGGLSANRVTREGDGREINGINGNVALSLRYIPRFNVTLSARRVFEPARFVRAGVQRRDLLNIALVYDISPRTNIALRGTRELRRYALPSGAPLQRQRDEIYAIRFQARHRIAPKFLIDGEIRHDSRSYDFLPQGVSATRIGLSAQLAI